MIDLDDTIVAIASPTSPADRGVVRLSGDLTATVLGRLGIDPPANTRAVRFPASAETDGPIGKVPIDVMLWPTQRSYSGQPSAELHTVGSLPVMQSIVQAAIAAGARAARPGEFTMRAFLAGRLDLTQAEAVLGVIEAEGRGSLDHALRQLSGNLSQPLGEIRATTLNLIADVEAGLDFVDEDIEFISDQTLVATLTAIAEKLDQTAAIIRSRGGGSSATTIALRGAPNAGKSSLFNRLAGDQVAIVADVPGTTRDTVLTQIDIGGHPVKLVDTAGIDSSTESVERQSQYQAQRASHDATIRIWCVDSSDMHPNLESLGRQADSDRRPGSVDLWVANKSDLIERSQRCDSDSVEWIHCSAVTGQGLDSLKSKIVESINQRDAEEIGSIVGTAARCDQSIGAASQAITNAIELTNHQAGHEFVASELRLCASHLGEVTGAVYTDDILDRVFGRFCIGK